MLLRILKTIFTFLYKDELENIKAKEDDLIKALGNANEKAEKYANEVRYVKINTFDNSSEEYKLRIKEIGEDPYFKFFLTDLEEKIITLLKTDNKMPLYYYPTLLKGLTMVRSGMIDLINK